MDPNSSTNLEELYCIEAGGVRILIMNISKKKIHIKGQFSRVHWKLVIAGYLPLYRRLERLQFWFDFALSVIRDVLCRSDVVNQLKKKI